MTSKERVRQALQHRATDRVPVDLWATPETYARLRQHFGAATDEEVRLALGVDIRVAGPRYTGPESKRSETPLEASEPGAVRDVWGVERKPVEVGGARYLEVSHYPLAGVRTVAEVDAYPWPDPETYDFDEVARQAEAAGDHYVVNVGHRLNRTGVLKCATYLRGMDAFLMDLALRPELARVIIRHVTDYYLAHNERIFRAARGLVDAFLMGDDFGTQTGLLVGRPCWREFFAPSLREFAALARDYGLTVMIHSCGGVRELIDDLIELGVEVLNPVQVRAAGMEVEGLKKDFGSRISFYGAIDIQEMLPHGSVEEVENEVERTIEVLGRGGGYILCSTHNIQPDTPVENILAMYRTAGPTPAEGLRPAGGSTQ